MTDKGQWEGVKNAARGRDSEDWDPENGKNVDIGGSEPVLASDRAEAERAEDERRRDETDIDITEPAHTDPDLKKPQ